MFPALLVNLTDMLRKVLQPLQADGALSLHIQVHPVQVVGHLLLGPEHALTPFNFTANCPLIVLGMIHLHVAFHIFHCLSTNRANCRSCLRSMYALVMQAQRHFRRKLFATKFTSHIIQIVFITSFKMVSEIYDCSSTF